jgi:hypothetical protein
MMRSLFAAAVAVVYLGSAACSSDEDDLFHAGGGADSGGQGGAGDAEAGIGGAEAGAGGAPSSDDSLEDVEAVRAWANLASALAVYVTVYQPIAVADGEETFADPMCPTLSDDGTTLEIAGGCTDADGKEWIGAASIVRSGDGNRDLTLDGFGTLGDQRTGEAQIRRIDDMTHEFDVDLVHETGTLTTYDYSGEVAGGYDSPTVWSGSGTVSREGDEVPRGRIEATTTNEVVDSAACSGQPASGNTTLRDRHGNTVIITYDGSIECDEEQAASYTLNDEAQGEITGIACAMSARHRRGGSFGVLGIVLGLASLGVLRKGRRQRVPRDPQKRLHSLSTWLAPRNRANPPFPRPNAASKS